MTLSLALLLFALPAVADSSAADTALLLLREAVTQYAAPFDVDWSPANMRVAWADLDADGVEDALVYLDGAAWCGSGGCTLLVFQAVDSTDVAELGAYTPVAEISLMHGPVTLSPQRTHGWRDLLVQGESGGWQRMAFDGETYPFSPSGGETVGAPVDGGIVVFADA